MSEPAAAPFSAPAFLPWWRRPGLLIAAVALVASALAFGTTLGGYFLGDDFGYASRFFNLPFSAWPRLFVNEWSEGIWGLQLRELRPLTALSLMIDAHLWGGNAVGFRVSNLLIHSLSAALVGLIAWRASGRALAVGLAGALLFAVHPAHAEPVLWITGRVDMVATLFYLAGCYAFLRYRETALARWSVALAAAYAAAAFSKEFGLTLPIMLLVADLVWRPGRAPSSARPWKNLLVPYGACAAVFVIYYFCRRAAFGPGGTGAALPDFASTAFHEQFAQRQLTYLGHLFPPLGTWFAEGTPLLAQHAVRTLLIVVAVVTLALITYLWSRRRRRHASAPSAPPTSGGVFFGLGWYLVATLPLVITYVSARHLYLASAGVCVAFALLLHTLFRVRTVFALATVALAALFSHRLTQTSDPWRDAGRRSHEVARELAWVAAHAKPGAAVFIDLPPSIRGAFFWEWATPFALRPPFTSEPLDARFVILEDMATHFDWERWHQRPVFAKLATITEESWLIQSFDAEPTRRLALPAARIRAAAPPFIAAPTTPHQHVAWRKFLERATAP
ncbi:MAG: hypothetical protein NTV51_07635 [Verrucomicrobia bacterium]|nr:hypothetical protein [Verrucomicrobiota bacterium]